MDDRLRFLIEYHMGHAALEEERVKGCDMERHAVLTGDDVVDWAIAELGVGQTSDAIVRLAMVQKPTTWSDVIELFRVAYFDLGYDKFTKKQHLLMHLKDIATRILDGSIAPKVGCAYIWRIIEHLDFPSDIDAFTCDMLLAGRHAETGVRLDETGLHREIMQYARSIVGKVFESDKKA